MGLVRREAHSLPSGPGAGPTGQTEWDPVTVLGIPNVAGCTDTELRKGSSRGLPGKKPYRNQMEK